jgi:hypothetical protein
VTDQRVEGAVAVVLSPAFGALLLTPSAAERPKCMGERATTGAGGGSGKDRVFGGDGRGVLRGQADNDRLDGGDQFYKGRGGSEAIGASASSRADPAEASWQRPPND